MALSSCPAPILIKDSCLTSWEVIGSGGFGQIYKARHQKWCCDVAVKLLHYDDGTSKSLLREIDMMRQGSSPYVIQVLGVFKGRPPCSGPSTQLGLVMEVMERGSLASLQDTLRETPPWPLVFRLTHQVALGINFLHNLTPALLHLDLKPSNVLLDSSLNAKLTDFGLSRVYHSFTRVSKKDSEEEGGTISYMPPEAFEISYSPTRASDIYSYGILLWSIVTGKQPYANAMSTMVRFRIPQGDRPSLDEISSLAAGRAGLARLMNLMERCWAGKPDQRPSSYECTTETEELYKMHKHAINDAVHQVLKKLDEKEAEMIKQIQRIQITEASGSSSVGAVNVQDKVPTGPPPVQEMAGGWTPSQSDKVTRVSDVLPPPPQPVSECDADPARSLAEQKVKVSSVHPIRSSPPPPSSGRSPERRSATSKMLKQNLLPPLNRQFSSPETLYHQPPPATGGIHIHMCNVSGFQYGNDNTMYIYSERRRHPTAPSRVDLPQPHSGSRKDKTGGVC